MLNPSEDDVTLIDDGTLDTVLACGDEEFKFSDSAEYRSGLDGSLDIEGLARDNWDDIRETMYERFSEYGLAFDYVEPCSDFNPGEGYLRFQISYGGPSEEIRFFVSPTHGGYDMHKAEFWYLDWFDGACVDVTNEARMLFDHFNDCESVVRAIREATDY